MKPTTRPLPPLVAFSALLLAVSAGPAFGQPEVMAWGNLTGIRVDGQLLEFGSGLCVVQPDWSAITRTDKERQTTSYTRNGKVQTVRVQMLPRRESREAPLPTWSMSGTKVVEETGPGAAKVDVEFTSRSEADIAGAFLCLDLPASQYSGGSLELIDPEPPAAPRISLAAGVAEQNEYVRAKATGARFISPRRRLEVTFSEPTDIVVRDDRRTGSYDLHVYLAVIAGKAAEGQTAKKSFALLAAGDIDRNPVVLALDAAHPGQLFDGLGGNFRLQNARTDPAVIQHNLDNLRVAWARVEMPWSIWHPNEEVDPLEAARAGTINPRIQQAMEMARTLVKKGMPVIVSAWSAPAWAVLGGGRGGFGGAGLGAGGRAGQQPGAAPGGGRADPQQGGGGQQPRAGAAPVNPFAEQQPDAPRGTPLNPEKMARIRESIAGYLLVLKEKYGVEAAMFSFNESDLGINVRQTAREHAELIKALGATFASKGLATRMLLGDTSDARPVDFIKAAMKDPEAVKYMGAVSFHSWRGCTDEILAQWRDAARELNLPLLVAEGSTDAAAWRYPQIFLEQSFALHEIELYTRMLAIAQPKSILQWQLTADYSLLAGGGVFGDNGPLRPTRRFWNLKQLASTPPASFSLPMKCGRPGLTCAAFGNIAEGVYTVHIVNQGAARPATLTGLPAGLKELRVWVTDSLRNMQEGPRISVTGGKAEFTIDPTSFTTLISLAP